MPRISTYLYRPDGDDVVVNLYCPECANSSVVEMEGIEWILSDGNGNVCCCDCGYVLGSVAEIRWIYSVDKTYV